MSPVYREWGPLLFGTIAISNSNGPSLQAYSNGCRVFNRKYEVMANGDSIVSGFIYSSYCDLPSDASPYPMGAVMIPWPGTKDSVFLFNLNMEFIYYDTSSNPVGPSLMFYSLIDLSLDDGYGAVVKKRQIAISDTLSRGHVRAVKHANGEDWWIVIPRSQSDCYYSLPVTKDGIRTPVYTCTEKIWGDIDAQGQATFSPDHTRYARFNGPGGLHLFTFDPETGDMTYDTGDDFSDKVFYEAGVAFSPSGRYLYATTDHQLYQYDLQAPDFKASRTLIAERDPTFKDPFTARFYLCVLAPDGRIYIAPSGQFNYLQVIRSPDCPGLACDFVQNHIKIYGSGVWGLPNIPFSRNWTGYYGCDTTTSTSDIYTETQPFSLYPNPADDYLFIKRNIPLPGMTAVFYNQFGQIVLQRELGKAFDTGLYVGEMLSGYYVIQLLDNQGRIVFVQPFVKT